MGKHRAPPHEGRTAAYTVIATVTAIVLGLLGWAATQPAPPSHTTHGGA